LWAPAELHTRTHLGTTQSQSSWEWTAYARAVRHKTLQPDTEKQSAKATSTAQENYGTVACRLVPLSQQMRIGRNG